MFVFLIPFSEAAAGSSDASLESLQQIFKNPILYIVLGAIALLLVAFSLWRRFIRVGVNSAIIIIRGGKIHRVLNEKNPRYYLVPFRDKVGAVIPLGEQELQSDKLYINDGPDALYQINYCLKYKIVDPKEHYLHLNSLQEKVVTSINDTLREFADQGKASILVKDYRQNEKEILSLLNKAIGPYSLEALSFKVNFISPLAKK